MKGIIVYAFAWRKKGHSPCNVRLARAAKRAAQSEPTLIFAQRTTAAVLEEMGVECWVAVKREGYEGSEDVTDQAVELFDKYDIDEVIPMAQPFLQLTKCVQLVRKKGYQTPSFWKLVRKIGWIGFDWDSVQPWTRDPIRLVLYTMAQMFFGYKPPPELSE